ncbi:MAG TPA: Hsp20/alpha crystallin family protein [Opitutales bacterium]|nr:Hsp20/alpha crystallin family protein [Opitutales bacterium]
MIQRYTPFEVNWDPFAEIQEMRQAMNRLFGSTDGISARGFPALNVYANGNEAVVAAELPGVEKEDVEISVKGSTFTLSGSRKTSIAEEGSSGVRRERFQGKFRRSVELPFSIESGKVTASLRNGILQVRLPRAESDKPRKIEIEA